jgi:hypothetical protein
LAPPRTLADAIGQGEQIGERERHRLGLREQPIGDVAAPVATQGVQVFVLDLPPGMFIQHPSVGSAIVVNAALDTTRQRLAIAHGYAHAVIEPVGDGQDMHARERTRVDRTARRRHAGAFLLPASGIEEIVRGLDKGQLSRQLQWVFDPHHQAQGHFGVSRLETARDRGSDSALRFRVADALAKRSESQRKSSA